MKQPSKTQLCAIKHLHGPAQVIAGPGSGKTFTIIQRILYLIKYHGISPNQILVITFTKAAALEMKARYDSAIFAESNLTTSVNFGTFHSICYHILQKSGGFSADSLIRENEKYKILKIILGNHGYGAKCNNEIIADILSAISRQKNIPGHFAEAGDFSKEEISIFASEYQEQLKEQKKLDFDDMIAECLKLLQNHKEFLKKYQTQFQYILVDEFQDINFMQYEVIKLLAKESENLFVVGDDDQAIYGFRGASPGIMQQFLQDYPQCTKIMMTENYRSGKRIVELAGKVIERNTQRFPKTFQPIREAGEISFRCLDSRKEEETLLLSELKALSKDKQAHTAVLLRTNREVVQYRELLKANGILVREKKTSDRDFFHGFIMEDLTAFLQFLYRGQKRRDFLKFMNKPNHYFTRLALTKEQVTAEDMKQFYSQNTVMQKEAELYFKRLDLAASLTPYMAVSFFRKTLGYDVYLKEKSESYQNYQDMLKQADCIQKLLKDIVTPVDAEKFFQEAEDKYGRKDKGQIKESAGLSVITMHSAKGLEFDHVFLPDVNEGVIPGKNCVTMQELEEERRLLYVAITRAKDVLHIYCTKERNRKPSSYLKGIILPQ